MGCVCPLLRCLGLLSVICIIRTSSLELTILHTNDVHARVEETSEDSSVCASNCYAGVARRLTAIRQIREKEKNVLLLDAGDQYQGTIWFNYFKGAEAAHFMRKLGYDAMALGNHEFDNGVDGLLYPFLQNVTFPVLSANIKADQQLSPSIMGYYEPYVILNVGGQKIGVVGYTTKETPILSSPGLHLLFEDEIEALQREVNKLTTLGVNKIIALGHSGFETDKQIAKKVKGVDVVVGGHSNTFLYTGTPPSNNNPVGLYPYWVKSDDGRNVPVVQAYAYGKYLGHLKVTFNDKGVVTKAEGNPILLNSSIAQDEILLADVNNWKKALASFGKDYIGKTLVYLNGTTEECRNRECNMGNLICEAMIYENIRKPEDSSWTHVSICLTQGGGIRSSIDEQVNNGTILVENILAVLPFGSTIDLLMVRGSTLRAAFEHSVRRYGQNTGEFLQVSGVHIEFDLSRKPGHRVVRLDVLCSECRVPHYEPLEDSRIYKIIVSSYIAQGGDGFTMLKNENLKHDTGDTDISVVSNYIKLMQRVYPGVDGRISFIGNSGTQLYINMKIGLLSVSIFVFFFLFC
ncbi:5'-nucleotidase isoform X1 [Rhincodon typus]|uniref:5'-nucleotidase isoform X1 n=2 Tax=Rhincodon typus TaxID=259920 RepID=UPI002030DECC|nr:5'-nucleotidase isoform X1 [Rhincodon typus]